MGLYDRDFMREQDEDRNPVMRFFRPRSFLDWSFPLFVLPARVPLIGGISVRLHLFYILTVGAELLHTLSGPASIFRFTAISASVLLVLVLLHEFGHCIACRAVRGTADRILLWPLGGLATCNPPHRWLAAFITTAGGPGVNVVLWPILGGALLLAGAPLSSVFFNPLHPAQILEGVFLSQSSWRIWLFCAYYMNFVLLAFNVLVPAFPMDGGRLLQGLLWWRLGYRRSMEIAILVGFFAAAALGVFGLLTVNLRLVGIALFCAATCFNERQILAALEPEQPWSYDTDRGHMGFGAALQSEDVKRNLKKLAKRQEQERSDGAKVDAILVKIKKHGIQSLSDRERQVLQNASSRLKG